MLVIQCGQHINEFLFENESRGAENERLIFRFNGCVKLFVCSSWKFDKCNSDSDVNTNKWW